MKIDFVALDKHMHVGSYRIWVHDVVNHLQEIGVDAKIVSSGPEVRSDSVLIFSKGDYHNCLNVPRDRIMGAINIAATDTDLPLDFIIVGSIEEKKSLERYYDNVVIVNLIETLYTGLDLKKHEKKQEIKIGYHGSFTHLGKLHPMHGFSSAFRELTDLGHNLTLTCVTDKVDEANAILEKIGIPKERTHVKLWDFNTILDDILSFDIGIVPNVTDLNNIYRGEITKVVSTMDGWYDTDYAYRFKNKSNAGRAFVFIQAGIPVITDLTPSNLPIFHDEKAGSIAVCKNTWQKSITRFMDHDERNKAAQAAIKKFEEQYDIKKDVINLVNTIEKIKKTNMIYTTKPEDLNE